MDQSTAVDIYLLVPASNRPTSRFAEQWAGIDHWCLTNNQKLNVSKSAELIMRRKGCRAPIDPSPTPGIGRATSLLMLGVVIESNFSFSAHLSRTISCASQSLYALKVLKNSGLPQLALSRVCSATLVSRLSYASSCWWGPIGVEGRQRLQGVLNRAHRWGVSWPSTLNITDICTRADKSLFKNVVSNSAHILHRLLQRPVTHTHNLRQRTRNRFLPLSACFKQN